MKFILTPLALLFTLFIGISQETIWFKPNKGQWHQNVDYKVKIPGGDMYLEENGITYHFSSAYNHIHSDYRKTVHENSNEDPSINGHVVKAKFLNANPAVKYEELSPSSFHENYFIGNDSTKWVSNLQLYNQIKYQNLYEGIDLHFYEADQTLKYDVIIAPHANPQQFKVQYTGQSKLNIEDDKLVINTTLGKVYESKPVAYQMVEGTKKNVPCEFKVVDDVVSFEFADGYDESKKLIIDPKLVFSTFTGSTSDNWGMTATPDNNDNMIAAGVVFGSGYPVTTGAYNTIFTSSQVDLAITKFTQDGTDAIYSTYLGGSESESPHSLVVDENNNLYVLGATSSANFPVLGNAYQTAHFGGPNTVMNYINFDSGTDIYVVKLNADGSSILGSTFYGGSDTDGISDSNDELTFNFGDEFRGEIWVDDNSDVYISSTTRSTNIPIVNGPQNSLSGSQDAIVLKFSSDLSTLLWSTYLGGSDNETGNSIALDSAGNIYVAGGTMSTNFPHVSSGLNSSYQGGVVDGYLTKFHAPLYDNPTSTYLGTVDYDQAYFVRVDNDNFVYTFGQTRGDYSISSGVYSNPSSGQFIHKLSNDLSANQWSTTVGAGSGDEELSPTAFLISNCKEIFIAGWGGITNNSSSYAINSSSVNMPITSNAYQDSTTGSNFYFAAFAPNMDSLKYGTYFGSLSGSNDHVDGGTSRFNEDGTLFHAICAACTGNTNGFPTTPGVFSETNNSINCNMAAVVFDLQSADDLAYSSDLTSIVYPQAGLTYQWLDCDNQFAEIPGATGQTFTPPYEGSFCVYVTDGNCLEDTSDCFLFVDQLGIDNKMDEDVNYITVYPNPTTGNTIIKKEIDGHLTAQITDISGREISKFSLKEKFTSMDLSNYASGTYFLLISSKEKKEVIKLVKQ